MSSLLPHFIFFILQFQGILKPAYNRVDVTEIEIMDDDSDPREFSEEIKELRRNIIMQNTGKTILNVKVHLDNMVNAIIYGQPYMGNLCLAGLKLDPGRIRPGDRGLPIYDLGLS